MRLISSFSCFLIAGILSFSNAQGYNAQPACTNASNPKVTELVMSQSGMNFNQCLRSVEAEWTQEAAKNREGKLDAAFAVYCNKVETLKKCLKDFTDSVKSCLRSDQHESVNLMNKIGASLIQYICDNSKLVQKIFANPCVGMCSTTKLQGLTNCANKLSNGIFAGARSQSQSEVNVVQVVQTVKISSDERGCSAIQDFEECSVKAMEDHERPVYSEVLDSVYKYINNDIPCKNLPKSSKSSASLASVVNLLLPFIPIIVMSL